MSTDQSAVVRCSELSHTYGTGPTAVVAVHGVTCTVTNGMRLAITGPSGSGKSTLLHLMAGLVEPTAGQLDWPALGGHPAGQPGLVGVVFQGPSLIPALNVVENVALPLILSGCTDAEASDMAKAALQTMELDRLGRKLPEELSGGQAQRVAIARVLALRPPLILADEPTGQLDRETGAHVIDMLLGAATALGASLVVSTHDTSVAQRMDSCWQMSDGALDTTDLPIGNTLPRRAQ
ncbi:MAG: ATP-binding cassette domain-containing protein [Actinomycetia bacterium]|nr:ATP-binding cassette domain-containing protein [Actinomycetes bacterium]